MKGILVKPFVGLTLMLLVCAVFSGAAYASENTDLDSEAQASLTVVLEADGKAESGIRIDIYQVADLGVSNGGFYYDSFFEGYAFEGMNASDIAQAAEGLSGLVQEAYASAETDSSGRACFEDLSFGIYLVELSGEYEEEGFYFDPYLVCVPLGSQEDGEILWTYEVESTPKTGSSSESTISVPAVGDGTPLRLIYSAFFLSLTAISVLSFRLLRNRKGLCMGKNNKN